MLMIPKKEGYKLKSLSTKQRPSHFLLVRIKQEGKLSLIIPLPLLILIVPLQIAAGLVWTAEMLFPVVSKKNISTMLCLFSDLLKELRTYGKWRMVEVTDNKNQVYVDFY